MSITLNQEAPAAVASGGDFKGGHWYGHTGAAWFPLYEPGKDFTLRQARKIHEEGGIAVPSVTTYLKVLHKEQLVRWREENVAKACWNSVTHAADGSTNKDTWVEQCILTASTASRGAADLGTRIHNAIEDAVAGKDYVADMEPYLVPVMKERAARAITCSKTEVCVGSLKYGYAGKLDDCTDATMTMRDYKSRKSKASAKKVALYETDKIQLSAYGFARWGNEFFRTGKAELWAISTTEPGKLTVHDFTGPELVPAFEAFLALIKVWSFENNYNAATTLKQ